MFGRGMVEWRQHVARFNPTAIQRSPYRFDQVLSLRFAIGGNCCLHFGDVLSVLYLAEAHSANLVREHIGNARGDRPGDGALFVRADHDHLEYCRFWSGGVWRRQNKSSDSRSQAYGQTHSNLANNVSNWLLRR